jgi:hypothetical protein
MTSVSEIGLYEPLLLQLLDHYLIFDSCLARHRTGKRGG